MRRRSRESRCGTSGPTPRRPLAAPGARPGEDSVRPSATRDPAGNLREKYDILLYGTTTRAEVAGPGPDTKWGPMPYTKTAQFPSHGVPDSSDDITGGIGWAGMANLQEYLNAGGLMITLGNGSALPLEGGLVRGVSERTGAYTPGSELRVKFVRPEHPVAYGYPVVTSAFRTDPTSPVRPATADVVTSGGRGPPKRARLPRDVEEGEDEKPARQRARGRRRRTTPSSSSRAEARIWRSSRVTPRSWTCPRERAACSRSTSAPCTATSTTPTTVSSGTGS
jgi:hypothetical protein